MKSSAHGIDYYYHITVTLRLLPKLWSRQACGCEPCLLHLSSDKISPSAYFLSQKEVRALKISSIPSQVAKMSTFLELPAEMRQMIYRCILQRGRPIYPLQTLLHHNSWTQPCNRVVQAVWTRWETVDIALLRVNHQVRHEALHVFNINTGMICDPKHVCLTQRPYSTLYMKDMSKRYERMSPECQRQQIELQLLAQEYQLSRRTLINETYPSLFLLLASVQINFGWASEGASQLDLKREHLRWNAPKTLKTMLEHLCSKLVQSAPDKHKTVVLLLPYVAIQVSAGTTDLEHPGQPTRSWLPARINF